MSDGGFVRAGEYGGGAIRLRAVLQCHANAGAGLAGSAATNGVDHHHGGAGLGKNAVDVSGGAGLFQTVFRQVFAHGDNKHLRIRHGFIIA